MSEKTVGVTLVGAAGRMGLEIVRAVAARPDVRLIGAVERAGCDHIGADAGRLAGAGDAGVAISSDIEAAADGADVVVDFGPPEATLGAIRAAEGAGAALLVGTTGLDARDAEAIDRAARRIAVLSASNLSVGIAVMASITWRKISVRWVAVAFARNG